MVRAAFEGKKQNKGAAVYHTSQMGLLVKVAVDHDILLGLAGVNDDNHGRAALLLVHVVLEARDLLLLNGRSL
jgi:hypothetical protein